MNRILVGIGILLMLGGCSSSWLPSLGGGGGGSGGGLSADLGLDSEPQGADARTSIGPACRTPCSVPVSTRGDFTVSFALTGFQPQTVSVRVEQPRERYDPESPASARFVPNPVFAELQAAPPPRSRRRSTQRKGTAEQPNTAAPRRAAPKRAPPPPGAGPPPQQ